jgi:XTP/dITP diphosphohydrolase
MPTVFVATSNAHKIDEVRAILGTNWTVSSPGQMHVHLDIEEDGLTFEANAIIKASAWAHFLKRQPALHQVQWVLGDDSGLEVDALAGEPGVHSARYAAIDSGLPGNSPDADNTSKLLRRLAHIPPHLRAARFKCAVAVVPLATPEPNSVLRFLGTCEGRILMTPQGTGGFGYDPVFSPVGTTLSFAQLGAGPKNQMSHRAKALSAASQALIQR